MKFYDRTKELEMLRFALEQSRKESRMTVVTGRRRIGKTELIKRCGDDTVLYFFVARKTEALLCQDFVEEAEKKLNRIIGFPTRFSDLFKSLLQLSNERPFTLIIDEFQDFQRVNPSIFSEIQRDWDLFKSQSHINLIISGSVLTMMKRIFEDAKEPLFGRASIQMTLRPFSTNTLKEILQDHNPNYKAEDLLALYTITGGVAYYVALMMDNMCHTKDAMIKSLFSVNSLLINEGRNLMVEEFGPESAIHFSIITCIANGAHTRGEIENTLNTNNIGSYLTRLDRYYRLIEARLPIFAKSNSKKMKYMLKDEFLTFWFRFFYKYQAFIENNALEQLETIIERDFSTFSGFALERYFETKLRESGQYTRIGKYWDRKGENEIDLIAVNEIDNTAEIYEIKRDKNKFDKTLLDKKINHLKQNCPQIKNMAITSGVLSLEDM